MLRSSRKNKELLEYITTELRSKRRKTKTITLVQFEYQHMTSPVLQKDLIRSKLSYYPLTRGGQGRANRKQNSGQFVPIFVLEKTSIQTHLFVCAE